MFYMVVGFIRFYFIVLLNLNLSVREIAKKEFRSELLFYQVGGLRLLFCLCFGKVVG